MIFDEQNQYSSSQALTATAASTNVIDHGSDRNIGIGEPMCIFIVIDVAADDTNADETYVAQLQTDTVVGFGSPTSIGGSITIPRGTAAGTRYVQVLPPDTTTERFTRINYTLGGTTPSVTLTAALIPVSHLANYVSYPDNITITG
jgi:hypothetical protein